MAQQGSSVTRLKLKNGLTVILEPNHFSPVAAVNVWVRVGSGCEGDDERGLAHFHEHMLFKGTENLGPGELAFEVESAGGRINAYTSFDQTVYHIISSGRSVGRSIDLLAESVTKSVFDPQELNKEIEVVVEEIRRDKDSPVNVMSRKLFAAAFEDHPYGLSILGTRQSVRSFTREKVLNFYRKWYSPRNMVVTVVGDFEPEKVVERIKKGFGRLKDSPVPDCPAGGASTRKVPSVSVLKKDVQEGYFALAFRVPAIGDDEVPTLDLISEIMGEGESSRLFRTVKEEEGLVNTVYSYSYNPVQGGVFVVGGTAKPENTASAFSRILQMLYALSSAPPGSAEIEKAKLNIESGNIRSKETVQGRARDLGFYETIAGDYRFEETYMEKIRSVSAQDISAVAARYFKPSNLSVVALVPQSSGISAPALRKAVSQPKPETVFSGKPHKTGVRKLKNGIKVIVKENKSVPVFAIRLLVPGGLRFEDAKTNGISNFTANMLTRGTSTRSAEQIADEMESLAGYIDGFSGRDSLGLSMDVLSSNFGPAMDIFSDVALNPSFAKRETARAKREIVAAIKRKKDSPSNVCIERFFSALFKTGPYSRTVLGTAANVKRFSRRDADRFYKKLLNPEQMVIVVAGDVDTEKVLRRLEKDFGALKRTGRSRPQRLRQAKTARPVQTVKKMADKQQTHIVVGFRAPKIGSADYYPFQVLNTILSGQGGRLFLKLRDEMSLAYSVSSFYGPHVDAGYFGVYIGTAAQKEESALKGISSQLENLLKNGVSDDEVKRAQKKVVGDFEIGLQTNSAQVSVIGFDELYGVGWDEYKEFADKVFAVTKKDILRAARKYIELDSKVVSIVRGEIPETKSY